MTEQSVTIDELKRIFTRENAQTVLKVMGIESSLNKAFSLLQENWDYSRVLVITRQIAQSPGGKYDPNKIPGLKEKREQLISKYKQIYGDELDWCFNPGQYDNFRFKHTRGELTYKNDLVLDPFAGSGTSMVAAETLNRRWIGIELSPNYCKIANERVGFFVQQKRQQVLDFKKKEE